jgi:hypothetical protein
MATAISTTATEKYTCPKCGAKPGEYCKTPKGRETNTPHGQRITLCSREDWDNSQIQGFNPF